ncbi:hypothetical protein DACRYDRAFT_112382 [Dacryopinax primogenitus]|uniref:Uncharacterized protein n=1 Tax=Dacryopinax primogenitus (strain DJM 731) TaxID=1858805 RepID=M5FQ63_DACPD|nr:uncharacterized protein DACRYDRAFT_112382 [Dacryopinax primogenitus]EJT96759.1 hypothetical protein DACRYDRAFT_112382 [Dacryopinax primogenitus]
MASSYPILPYSAPIFSDSNSSVQCVYGSDVPDNVTPPPSDSGNSEDFASEWPTTSELQQTLVTKCLPDPRTRSFRIQPSTIKSALQCAIPKDRVSIQVDCTYLIAYDIRTLSHDYRSTHRSPIVA